MNIVHITQTTLAGAPAMLSEAQKFLGFNSICFQIADAKPERLVFSPGTIAVGYDTKAKEILSRFLAKADIIHFHGQPARNQLDFYNKNITTQKIILQLHSAENEHPKLIDCEEDIGFKIHKKLIVAHSFARTYANFIPVPNCLFRSGLFYPNPHIKNPQLKVILSQDTKPSSRYGHKIDHNITAFFVSLQKNKEIQLLAYKNIPPELLFLERMLVDITIDDLLTGGFHLVSYEGLACGNVVMNGADEISIEIFRQATHSNLIPPFLYTTAKQYASDFLNLIESPQKISEYKSSSIEYYHAVLTPKKVVDIYTTIYEELL